MFGLTFQEGLVIGIIAIVLFGSQLPEVARNAGMYYAKIKRMIFDLQSQVNLHDLINEPLPARATPAARSSGPAVGVVTADDYDEPTAPVFEPPPQEPVGGSNVEPRLPSAVSEAATGHDSGGILSEAVELDEREVRHSTNLGEGVRGTNLGEGVRGTVSSGGENEP